PQRRRHPAHGNLLGDMGTALPDITALRAQSSSTPAQDVFGRASAAAAAAPQRMRWAADRQDGAAESLELPRVSTVSVNPLTMRLTFVALSLSAQNDSPIARA